MISSSASQIWQSRKEVPTAISLGCPKLDETTGGVPLCGITEVSGEAGSGKTQFCMMLSLQAQLDSGHGGVQGSTAYMCGGEGLFPIRRLSGMAQSFASRTGFAYESLLANIHIEQCHNIDDVFDALNRKVPEMCTKNNVRVLIIDSIAGLMRHEYDCRSSRELGQRTSTLLRLASKLKWLADIFGVCVVVVNQVTARYGDEGSAATIGNSSVPALGLAWSHCVNTRIVLQKRHAATRKRARLGAEGCEDSPAGRALSPVNLLCTAPSAGSRAIDIGQHYELGAAVEEDGAHVREGSGAVLRRAVKYFPQSQGGGGGRGGGSCEIGVNVLNTRTLLLELSPSRPLSSCHYAVTENGLVGVC